MNSVQRGGPDAAGTPEVISAEHVAMTVNGPRLLAGRCQTCGSVSFPLAGVCHKCWSHAIAVSEVGPKGTLYSYSTVHIGSRPWRTPYVLGYVDVTPELRLLAHIQARDARAITIGSTVQLTLSEVPLDDGQSISTFVFAVVDAGESQASKGAIHA